MSSLLSDLCVKDKALELHSPKYVSSLRSSSTTEMSFRTTAEFLIYIKQETELWSTDMNFLCVLRGNRNLRFRS
jgi:hypothetical protein